MSTIPGIPYGPAPRAQSQAGGLTTPPPFVVVHATDNPTSNAHGEANYAATRTDSSSNWTSCHAYVDASGPLGSLPLHLRAWSAYSWANAHGWHIELCGVSGRVPLEVQRNGAALVRQLCQLGGIPMVHRDGAAVRAYHDGAAGARGGVTGHGDITAANFDNNDHTDPGFSTADWGRFMGWVTGGVTPSTLEDDMGKQLLVADSTGVVWLVDGLTRVRVADLTGAGNGQAHQEALLGNLGNNGQVARFGTPPEGMDVWGIDVAGRLAAVEAKVTTSEAADQARDAAALAAINALATTIAAGGGSVDTVAITAAINAAVTRVHDDVKARFAAAGSVA